VLMVNQRRRQHFGRQLEELMAKVRPRRGTSTRSGTSWSRPESPAIRLTRPWSRWALRPARARSYDVRRARG
jgi:hypothetical protein